MSERHDLDSLPISWDLTHGELKLVLKGLETYVAVYGEPLPNNVVNSHCNPLFSVTDMINKISRVITFTEETKED